MLEGDREVAYVICADGGTHDYVLISLLAVNKKLRGSGFGTVFLEKLKTIYSDKDCIIIEVEMPEYATTTEEKVLRERRIGFYQKEGYYILSNIEYSIWDIPMHLMALPLKASVKTINDEIEQIIYKIYLSLMGERYIHKMKIGRLSGKNVKDD